MYKDIYKDAVIQLKHPITIPDEHKISGLQISSLRHVAKQEIIWASQAHKEYTTEYNRAMNLPKGDPLRNELLWDSRVALDFYKIRKARASRMLVEAEKLEKSLRR
jgi:hypothetical protein